MLEHLEILDLSHNEVGVRTLLSVPVIHVASYLASELELWVWVSWLVSHAARALTNPSPISCAV